VVGVAVGASLLALSSLLCAAGFRAQLAARRRAGPMALRLVAAT